MLDKTPGWWRLPVWIGAAFARCASRRRAWRRRVGWMWHRFVP